MLLKVLELFIKIKSAVHLVIFQYFHFNGNKIITTSGGGMILSKNELYIKHAHKLSTQSRERTNYYEHKEIGYNYRMSNVLAGIGLAQLSYIDYHLKRKKKFFKNIKQILIILRM